MLDQGVAPSWAFLACECLPLLLELGPLACSVQCKVTERSGLKACRKKMRVVWCDYDPEGEERTLKERKGTVIKALLFVPTMKSV